MSAKDTDANTKNKVIVSTIHSAKGLEWRTVFILDCNETNFKARQNFNKNDGGDDDDEDGDDTGFNNEEEKRLF